MCYLLNTDKFFQKTVKNTKYITVPNHSRAPMVTQLEHHQQQRPCLDPAERTKSLICALNFISRNLPVPPDVYDAVSSIYYGDQDSDNDVVRVDGGSDEGTVVEKPLVRVFEVTLLIAWSVLLGIVANLGFLSCFCDALSVFVGFYVRNCGGFGVF